jgi:hypothetical protein
MRLYVVVEYDGEDSTIDSIWDDKTKAEERADYVDEKTPKGIIYYISEGILNMPGIR